MKKICALLLLTSIFISCKKNNFQEENIAKSEELLTIKQINAFIKTQQQTIGKFEWSTASDVMIWSALQKSDKIASIGYKPAAEVDVANRLHLINIQDAAWVDAKEKTLWFQLVLFCLISMSNAMLWITFSPVANIAAPYYGVTPLAIDC